MSDTVYSMDQTVIDFVLVVICNQYICKLDRVLLLKVGEFLNTQDYNVQV